MSRSDDEEDLDWEREKRRQKDIRKRLEETEWESSSDDDGGDSDDDDGDSDSGEEKDKSGSEADGDGKKNQEQGNENGGEEGSSSSEEESEPDETAEEKKAREEDERQRQEVEAEKKRKEEEGIQFLLRKYFPESLQKQKEEEAAREKEKSRLKEIQQEEEAAVREKERAREQAAPTKRTSWGGPDSQREAPHPLPAGKSSSSDLRAAHLPQHQGQPQQLLPDPPHTPPAKSVKAQVAAQGHRRAHSTSQAPATTATATASPVPGMPKDSSAGSLPRLSLSTLDGIAGEAGAEAAILGSSGGKKAMSPRGEASKNKNRRRSVVLGKSKKEEEKEKDKEKEKEAKKKEKEKEAEKPPRRIEKEVKREVSAVFCYSDRLMMMEREEAERRRQQELRIQQMREEQRKKQAAAASGAASAFPSASDTAASPSSRPTSGDMKTLRQGATTEGNHDSLTGSGEKGDVSLQNKNQKKWEQLLHIPQESLTKARQERLRADIEKNSKAQKHLEGLSPRALEKTISELLLLDPEAGERLLAERIRQDKERRKAKSGK